VAKRSLVEIRAYFAGLDPEAYLERVFTLAGVRYAIMTNIPFNQDEARHFRPQAVPFSSRLRTALRLDPLLLGRWDIVEAALRQAGYPVRSSISCVDAIRRHWKGRVPMCATG
jgi:hypothetical protein